MTDFEVVYTFGPDKDWVLISKVYAVNENSFLLVDAIGKFIWVPMRDCILKEKYDTYASEREEAREVVSEVRTFNTFDDTAEKAVNETVAKMAKDVIESVEKHRQDRHWRGLYG